MGSSPEVLYDRLAESFHLIFEDWNASISRQARAIDGLFRRWGVSRPDARVLDCACGIGTQLLGLAQLGYSLTGCDIAAGSVARARREAEARGLSVTVLVADMRNLSGVPGDGYDAVIAMDNSLPHLDSDEELLTALRQIRGKLRAGGVFVASVRDYDRLVQERPTVQGPAFLRDGERRRIVHQVWDWADERRYHFHLYITRETETGWETIHGTGSYRAVLRDELSALLRQAGFTGETWVFPDESEYYQPVCIARK